jgi:hypothetical protein
MALKKSHQSKFGILIQDAYFKVSSVSGSKLGAIITVDVYASDEASKSGSHQVDSSRFDFTPSQTSKTWDAQAYEHLKTLPEFAGATDC